MSELWALLVAHHVPWFVLGAAGILAWPLVSSWVEDRRLRAALTRSQADAAAPAAADLRASLVELEASRAQLAQKIAIIQAAPAARRADALEPPAGHGSRTEARR